MNEKDSNDCGQIEVFVSYIVLSFTKTYGNPVRVIECTVNNLHIYPSDFTSSSGSQKPSSFWPEQTLYVFTQYG